ncbi:MAG: heme A synthase [Candidatus Eremiobacteraeota bacterium]|nr:heme A synthase [Candidatus Eremiobacteraeota bacterium]
MSLALAADLFALATLMLGSWTRINGAGLTCPDWPLCHGRLLPSLRDGTFWEWSHRLLAFSVAPLVIALAAVAWRQRHRSAFITPTLALIGALFAVQVFLGAETVRLANAPFSVVLHWATAMALIASLSAMAVFAAASNADPPSRHAVTPRSASILFVVTSVTAIVAFATMCVGAYVSSSGAGLACLSIPECAGNVVVHTPGQFVQMLHRFAAAATLICAAGTLALAWAHGSSIRVRAAVGAGAALVCVQVMLGLLNVALRLPMILREAHAVNAALVFLTFFVGAAFALLDAAPVERTASIPRSAPSR